MVIYTEPENAGGAVRLRPFRPTDKLLAFLEAL